MSQPDNKKFFENLSGAGEAIAVLTTGGDAQDSPGSLKMTLIRVFIIGSLLSLLEAHTHCTKQVKWGNLLQTLNSMSNGISETCAHHYNIDSLCDPVQMLSQVDLNAILLADVMKRVESIYEKNPNRKHFTEALQHSRHILKPCTHHSHNFDHKLVDTCFNRLEAFIHDKTSHIGCAWEIINVTVKELLQRLENRMLR